MPDLEFTGERIIPGLVEANLYNEHIARYRLAARLIAKCAPGGRVLDAGCGSGYGSAEFQAAGRVVAVDASADAVLYARDHYRNPRASHAQARCEALPFADQSFDVIVAFEVIEHLENWSGLLTEAHRVLRPGGLLLVSTPNTAFYAETRAHAGPNLFHVHEFDHAEFSSALNNVFPHVAIWWENHGEGIVFTPPAAVSGEMEIAFQANPEEAHFFLGICSSQPLPPAADLGAPAFAWMPEGGNILQTRARHIALLTSEVDKKTAWLGTLQIEHAKLVDQHKTGVKELERSNNWAAELNARIANSKQEIDRRDQDLDARREWIDRLRAELSERDASILAWKDKNASLETELVQAHLGYQNQMDAQAAEFGATIQQWMNESARIQEEQSNVSAGYEAQLIAVQNEANKTATSWRAECDRIAAAYEAQILALQQETVKIATAYEENNARIEAELGSVHAGYQKALAVLQSELTDCHSLYGQFVAAQGSQAKENQRELLEAKSALNAARAQLRAVHQSKWNRLGRAAGLGPKVNTD